MKKSTQERLALKILIDRPKARNEVGGWEEPVIDVRRRSAFVCRQCSGFKRAFLAFIASSPERFYSVGSAACKKNPKNCLEQRGWQRPSVLTERLTQPRDALSKHASQTRHGRRTVKAAADKQTRATRIVIAGHFISCLDEAPRHPCCTFVSTRHKFFQRDVSFASNTRGNSPK